MYLSQTIRKYLGWCPRTHALPLHLPVLKDNFSEDTPAQEGGIPARTGWSQRYRNQVLLMAVAFTLAAFPAVTFFQTNDPTRLMMYIGTITGLGLFAFFGRWLWNSFEMLAKGMTIQTGPGEYIISFFIAGAIPLGVVLLIGALLALIPLAGALAFPAFATGFAFVPWYVLALILLWERRTGCTLMFDKKTRSFTAARCSGNAYD